MRLRILTLALLFLAEMAGCSGPRQLDTSMGGRQLEELHAEARKIEGQWWCELRLPLGTWRAETIEGQSLEIFPDEPRATLRWKVAPDRWSQQDRPFLFDLVGKDGTRLSLSVRYPSSLPGGEFTVNVFRVLSGRP